MKKQLLRIFFIVSAVALIVISCKKDGTNEKGNPLNDAKEWYQQSTLKSTISLNSSNGDIKGFKREILWNDAKIFTMNDGIELVGAPVSVTFANGNTNGSYMLLICKSGTTYTSLVAYNEKNDYFNANVSNADVQLAYQKAVNLNATHKNNKLVSTKSISASPALHKGSIMVVDENPEQICTDWYWTTYYYDQWGNIIDVIETYLYTTCHDSDSGGGSGSGEPQDPNCSNAEQSISAYSTSINAGITLEEQSTTTKKQLYSWKFLENTLGLWHYTSVEEGVLKKVGNEWQWESLTHKSVNRTGTVIGSSITCTATGTPSVGIYYAGMELSYEFNASMICAGFPVSKSYSDIARSPLWFAN